MLVPSTFTGWYRKIMMKAEIASEMIRSRSQTESTGKVARRDGRGNLLRAGTRIRGTCWFRHAAFIIRAELPGLKVIVPSSSRGPTLPWRYCRRTSNSVTITRTEGV